MPRRSPRRPAASRRDPGVAGTQARVGGELGVVAARRAAAAAPSRAARRSAPPGPGHRRARVEARPHRPRRLRPAGSARRFAAPGRRARRIRLTAASRWSTAGSVPITSISQPGTPRSRISAIVRLTPCVAPMPSASSATRSGSASSLRPRGSRPPCAARWPGTRSRARTESRRCRPRRCPGPRRGTRPTPPSASERERRLDGTPQTRSCRRHARR